MQMLVTHYMGMLLLSWLAVLASLVFYRLLTGGILLDGLLARTPNGPISPERMQPMIASLIAVGGYALSRRRAIAFILPNRRFKGRDLGEFRVPVSEVEELTGINFFTKFSARYHRVIDSRASPMWHH